MALFCASCFRALNRKISRGVFRSARQCQCETEPAELTARLQDTLFRTVRFGAVCHEIAVIASDFIRSQTMFDWFHRWPLDGHPPLIADFLLASLSMVSIANRLLLKDGKKQEDLAFDLT